MKTIYTRDYPIYTGDYHKVIKIPNVRKYFKYVDTPWTQPVLKDNGLIDGGQFAVENLTGVYSTYYTYRGFDNVASTQMGIAGYTGEILMYSPTPLKVSKIEHTNQNANANLRTTLSGDIYGSNDNVNFTLLTSYTNDNQTNSATWDITVNSTNYYNYHKMTFNKTNTTYNTFCAQLTLIATQGIPTESTSSDYDYYIDIDEYKAVA